jgi:hypothetical protein
MIWFLNGRRRTPQCKYNQQSLENSWVCRQSITYADLSPFVEISFTFDILGSPEPLLPFPFFELFDRFLSQTYITALLIRVGSGF